MKQITGKLFVLSVAYVPAAQKWEVLPNAVQAETAAL